MSSAASLSPRERFEASHEPQDFLGWLNAYTNQGRGDDELHALCSWAHSVIAELQNKVRISYPATPVDCLLSELRECFDLSADDLISRRQFENRVAEFRNEAVT